MQIKKIEQRLIESLGLVYHVEWIQKGIARALVAIVSACWGKIGRSHFSIDTKSDKQINNYLYYYPN